MILTREYIMAFRTVRGSWTLPQIAALGIDWPPRKGWIDRVTGCSISADNQVQFESRIGIKQLRKGAQRDLLKEIEHLENAMREIQAATSDKAVLDITDRALCDETGTAELKCT